MKARREAEALESQLRLATWSDWGYPSHTKAVHSIIKTTPRQLNPSASTQIKKPTVPTQTSKSEILLPVKKSDFFNVPDEESVKPGSSTKKDDSVRAEKLPKETMSKSCTKGNHSDVPRAKVSTRKETSESCTNKMH